MNGSDMHTYIFFRREGWYPIACKNDADVYRQVELNPGTVKVEDATGRVVWRKQ